MNFFNIIHTKNVNEIIRNEMGYVFIVKSVQIKRCTHFLRAARDRSQNIKLIYFRPPPSFYSATAACPAHATATVRCGRQAGQSVYHDGAVQHARRGLQDGNQIKQHARERGEGGQEVPVPVGRRHRQVLSICG